MNGQGKSLKKLKSNYSTDSKDHASAKTKELFPTHTCPEQSRRKPTAKQHNLPRFFRDLFCPHRSKTHTDITKLNEPNHTNHLNLNRNSVGNTTNNNGNAIKKPPITAIAKG